MPPVWRHFSQLEGCLARFLEVRDVGIKNLKQNLSSSQFSVTISFRSVGLHCSVSLKVVLDQWFLDLDQKFVIYTRRSF